MKKITATILFLLSVTCIFSQQHKALLIAIDNYEPPKSIPVSNASGRVTWPDLAGCKNDALSVKAIITASFGFTAGNIGQLFNEAAGRKNILDAFEKLLQTSNEGDIVFIYYAGHGSQVKNSLSGETDKKDESIVPSDTWKEGVADIRDKELARIFNRFIDKKIKLTAIFDCCHSGSIGRGLYKPAYRYISESQLDAKDSSKVIAPENRPNSGYLVLSATQDNEYAQEQLDEQQVPHGAFTLALIKALNQQPAGASAQNIFSGARAILKSNGKSQEPVLAGDINRFDQNLFGISKADLPSITLFPVLQVKGNTIFLQGGHANGLNPGNELTKQSDSIKIKVLSITGIDQCEAVLLNGSAKDIKPGELFEVSNWVSSAAPLLNIYIPGGNYSYDDVLQLCRSNMQLKNAGKLQWLSLPLQAMPDLLLNADRNKYTLYDFSIHAGAVKQLTGIDINVIHAIGKGKSIFVNLPLCNEVKNDLVKKLGGYQSIKIVEDPAAAQYMICGSTGANGKPVYALIRNDLNVRDSLASMPLCSKPWSLEDKQPKYVSELLSGLFETMLKLSKIRGWQILTSPASAGSFPYHLVMRNKLSGKIIDDAGAKNGEPLSLSLEANDDYLVKTITAKYIYLFAMDINGNMQLLYPRASEGNSQNKFPFYADGLPVKKFIIHNDLEAAEPVGTDNYFLLASKDPISSYMSAFTQEGVRGNPVADDNPLASLLQVGNENSARGLNITTPANWNLLRLQVKVIH